MDPQIFGAFIQQRRKALGLSQAELAEKLHVTAKAVSRWERGVGFPDIKLLQPLADGLEITIVEMMQSQLLEAEITKEIAAAIVSDTVSKIQTQEKLSLKKKLKLVTGTAVIILAQILLFYVYFFYDIEPWWADMGLYMIAFSGGHFCVRVWYHLVTGIPMPAYKFAKTRIWWVFFTVMLLGLVLMLLAAIHGGLWIFDQGLVFVLGMALFCVGWIFMNIQEDKYS